MCDRGVSSLEAKQLQGLGLANDGFERSRIGIRFDSEPSSILFHNAKRRGSPAARRRPKKELKGTKWWRVEVLYLYLYLDQAKLHPVMIDPMEAAFAMAVSLLQRAPIPPKRCPFVGVT